jgi:hypothetical protein
MRGLRGRQRQLSAGHKQPHPGGQRAEREANRDNQDHFAPGHTPPPGPPDSTRQIGQLRVANRTLNRLKRAAVRSGCNRSEQAEIRRIVWSISKARPGGWWAQRRASPTARPSGRVSGGRGPSLADRNGQGVMGRSVQSHFIRLSLSAPEVLEPIWPQLGVANRVLDVLVAQVGLQSPGIVALVHQRKATGMPQHVRVSLGESAPAASPR